MSAKTGSQLRVEDGGADGSGRLRKSSFVFTGCGVKLIPSSAKNSMNDARKPFSTHVLAKARSEFTSESSWELKALFCPDNSCVRQTVIKSETNIFMSA